MPNFVAQLKRTVSSTKNCAWHLY